MSDKKVDLIWASVLFVCLLLMCCYCCTTRYCTCWFSAGPNFSGLIIIIMIKVIRTDYLE
jgi:hypothetical protein